jgi:hypothetical protein
VLKCAQTELGHRHIKMTYSPPHQHAQLVERHVCTVIDRCRTMKASMTTILPEELYGELYRAAATYINMFPTSHHHTTTPIFLMEGDKPDLDKQRLVPFGTVVMVCEVRREKTSSGDKLAPKSQVGVVLGPSLHSHSTMQVYIPETGKVVSRNDFEVLSTVPISFPWATKPTVDVQYGVRLQPSAGYKTMSRHGRRKDTDGRLAKNRNKTSSQIATSPLPTDGLRSTAVVVDKQTLPHS